MDIDFLISNTEALTQVSSDIISYNSQYGIKTRAQTEISTSSCRMWQLILAILDNLDEYCVKTYGYGVKDIITRGYGSREYGSREYYDLLININFILEKIKRNPLLNSLIYLNQPVDGYVENYDPRTTELQYGNNYMCIYIDRVDNSILHYFTVIRTPEEEYYLNSSYGSDYVCVNQYTTLMEPNEFIRFIDALNNHETDERYIEDFFNKFFLANNVGKFYTKDDWSEDFKKRFKKMLPVEGNKKEVDVLAMNLYRTQIKCGIINNYKELIINIIYEDEEQASKPVPMETGGGRIYKKRTIKRSHKSKSKKIRAIKSKKIRKTKRHRSSKRCSR
jgi:hypothetical protein